MIDRADRSARLDARRPLPPEAGRWDGAHVAPAQPAPAPVLLADLGSMTGSGMAGMLADRGMEVVTAAPGADLRATVQRIQPSAVVLDLDGADPLIRSAVVREACPAAKVVLWARREDVMEIFDPGATAPRFVLGTSPAELCAELTSQPGKSAPEDDSPCPTT